MSEQILLAIDQGTSNTKALLVDETGAMVARSSVPVGRHYPRPGWVEQDPIALWDSVTAAIAALPGGAPVDRVVAIALTNQRESVVLWDRATGMPLGPSVSWQCRRGVDLCDRLRELGAESIVRTKTGLQLDPAYSAPKAAWLLDQVDPLRERAGAGQLCVGTIDSWLLWNLTAGVHATDVSNASRTLLFDIHTLEWDDELLKLFAIPRASLPRVLPSSGWYGEAVDIDRLPSRTPVCAVIADSHAALLGQGCLEPGAAKATFGTGTSVMTLAPSDVSIPSLSSTVAWSVDRETAYAVEGNIMSTGATVQWVADLVGLPGHAEVERLAATAQPDNGVYLVPAFAGLGAPYWDGDARAVISGLTFAAGAAELSRAALESTALQVRDVVEAFDRGSATPIRSLHVDGGGAANDLLAQFQADILGRPVIRFEAADAAAIGAAYLAGLVVETWGSLDAVALLPQERTTFEPVMTEAQRDEIYLGWLDAVARSRVSPTVAGADARAVVEPDGVRS